MDVLHASKEGDEHHDPYDAWEQLGGHGRILPAFPGAGGSIERGVLKAALTPAIVQPTTFGEIGSADTERQRTLAMIMKKSHIPYRIVPDMYKWQLSHLGLVVPLADAYYLSQNPAQVFKDKKIMRLTAERIKRHFSLLAKQKMLSPFKFQVLRHVPLGLMAWVLSLIYRSEFGRTFMYEHSMKAPGEIRHLRQAFYRVMEIEGERKG